jgi:hypothetical protein
MTKTDDMRERMPGDPPGTRCFDEYTEVGRPMETS